MKKLILFSVIALMGLTASAQHKHIHIYHNSTAFTTHKLDKVEEMNFYSTSWGDDADQLSIALKDGSYDKVDINDVSKTVIGTNVPVIYVNLTDYPDLTDLMKDSQHTKSFVYAATLSMDGNGFFDDIPETEVEFRGRGNSTWNMPKTPYRFKLPKKQSVCGLPKAKTFALIANFIDCSLMRNTIALKTANMLEMPFSNHCVPVAVYLNGHYKGAYMLTEKIGVGGGSVDIDENEGILFEFDSNYDEDFRFRYYWTPSGSWSQKTLPVMVKDPDLTEIAAADPTGATIANDIFSNWKADITTMLDAVTSRSSKESLSDVLDLESVANFLIVNNLACNRELQHPKSFYMYKEALGTEHVYHFGPVWDFDWAFTFDGYEGQSATRLLFEKDGDTAGATFFQCICKNEEFRALYKQKWENFKENLYPELLQYLEEYANHIEPSAVQNGTIWTGYTGGYYKTESTYNFRDKYATLIKWLNERVEFISNDANFGLYK